MATALMMAALFTSIYIYHHPTSSISLFFLEVSQLSFPLLFKTFTLLHLFVHMVLIKNLFNRRFPNTSNISLFSPGIFFFSLHSNLSPQRRPNRWPVLKFRRRGDCSSYTDVESPGQDKDTMEVIDPKQCFVLSDRRESEQKEGFIVPDQRERFLVADTT